MPLRHRKRLFYSAEWIGWAQSVMHSSQCFSLHSLNSMLNTLKKFALTLHVHGLACMHAREYARHLQGINQFPRAQSCPSLAAGAEKEREGMGPSSPALLLWHSNVWGVWFQPPPPLRKNTSDISWQWEHWWCCRGPNGACACVCVTHQHTEQTVVFRHYSSGNRSHIDNIYFAATQFRAELHACDFGLNGVSNDSQIIQPPFLTHVAALFVNLPPLF